MKISVLTLGCKVNFYESEGIINELEKLGHDISNKLEYADVFIINTCCVTNEGERKSRQMITKCLTYNPYAKIIVCGCAVQKNPTQFENKNVSVIIGNSNKKEIINLINSENVKIIEELPSIYLDNLKTKAQRVRAYLKIQDGCNNFCSYCIIPYVRGRSRSREISSIVSEAENLSKTCNEIVLTGINMSDFKPSLIDVLESLSGVKARIRISSLEVNVITEDFLNRLSKLNNFCPHFHLSLQSGSDSVLKKMNRHYTSTEYLNKVSLIKKYFPYASITTDVIVGFPTESEENFAESLETIKKAEFFMVHCFPYSIRVGTPASKMPQVLNSVKKQRVKIVESLSKILGENYINKLKQNNVTQNVILEEIIELYSKKYFVGHSQYFVKCYIPYSESYHENDIISVKINEFFEEGVICK